MKLDNYGWGLNEMLIYCAILLFFLLIAVFYIYQLSSDLGDSFKDDLVDRISYEDVERNVKNAADSYIDEYYQEEIGSGTITITVNNLLKYKNISNDLLTPSDEKNPCDGYALITKNETDLDIDAFITCDKYETKGYQSWRLGD